MKDTLVVSAFPATGKSYLFEHTDKVVLDSDSSDYSWISPGVRNPDFPRNYIEHIQENLGKCDLILVSTHKAARDALVEAGIDFTLVYPTRDQKSEYLERCRVRGSSLGFIAMLRDNWDDFLLDVGGQVGCTHIQLEDGQFLTDVLNLGVD